MPGTASRLAVLLYVLSGLLQWIKLLQSRKRSEDRVGCRSPTTGMKLEKPDVAAHVSYSLAWNCTSTSILIPMQVNPRERYADKSADLAKITLHN